MRNALSKSFTAHLRIVLPAVAACIARPVFGLSPARSIDQYVHTTWDKTDGLPEDAVLSISETPDGYLLLATPSARVRFDGARFVPEPGYASPASGKITYRHAGRTWTGTPAGLIMRDGEQITTMTTEDGLSSNEITALLEDKDGNLWIGTRDGVLHRFRDGVLERSDADGEPENGGIFALAEDQTGALWVGTGRGLERYQDGTVTTFGRWEGFPESRILLVAPRGSGGLYVLDATGALYIFEDGRASIVAEEGSISDTAGADLLETADGALWIGGCALHRFQNGRLESFSSPRGNIAAILPDGDGLLIARTDEDGTGRLFHFLNGVFSPRYEDVPLLHIEGVFRDSRNRLWIPERGGIVRIDGASHRIFTAQNGLPDDAVFDVIEAPKDTYWVSTRRGLARIRGDQILGLANIEGVPTRQPRHLVLDPAGHLIISADDGIYRILLTELNHAAEGARTRVPATVLTTRDGLRSLDILDRPAAVAQTREGTIWFATARGLSMFSPDETPRKRPAPQVVIAPGIRGETHNVSGDGISLPQGAGPLQIRFSAPALKDETQAFIRYRLKGFEDAWTTDTGIREAVYVDLPAGEYIFEAAAFYRDGVVGKPIDLPVTIVPRWYATVWARLLFISAAGLFLAAMVWQARRRFPKKRGTR